MGTEPEDQVPSPIYSMLETSSSSHSGRYLVYPCCTYLKVIFNQFYPSIFQTSWTKRLKSVSTLYFSYFALCLWEAWSSSEVSVVSCIRSDHSIYGPPVISGAQFGDLHSKPCSWLSWGTPYISTTPQCLIFFLFLVWLGCWITHANQTCLIYKLFGKHDYEW